MDTKVKGERGRHGERETHDVTRKTHDVTRKTRHTNRKS
jgi:hypothetical protein